MTILLATPLLAVASYNAGLYLGNRFFGNDS